MTIAWLDSVMSATSTTPFFRYWPRVAIILLWAVSSPSNAQQRYHNDYDTGSSRDSAPRHNDERGSHNRNDADQRGNRGAVVRCESTDQGYQHCRADTRDGVQLYRQLSKNACRYNESWGYDRRGVWVNRGCRGDFQLYTGRSGGDGRQKDDDHTAAAVVGGAIALGVLGAVLSEKDTDNDTDRARQLMRCESDGDYRHCRAEVRNGVRLHRQLSRSSCRQNESWGYDRRGVWVDRGCRAEFSVY